MLIYCAHLDLVPNSPAQSLLSVCADWLRAKTRKHIAAADLAGDGEHRNSDGSWIEWLTTQHENASWHGIRFGHPDKTISGRSWLTEIGIHRTPGRFLCSVLLRTEEHSALVNPNVQTTRPKLVADIVERCSLSAEMCGAMPKSLRLDDAEAFLSEVHNPERRHPIVQVSSTVDGKYLVSPERAASQLAGIAVVAQIPPDVDTFTLQESLTPRFSCYHGAVNIIWPIVGVGTSAIVPCRRVMPHEIETVRAKGSYPETHLLATLCHRLNAGYARDHITPEMVRAVKHRAALDEARRQASKPDPELAELTRVVDEEQRSKIASLEQELKKQDAKIEELEGRFFDAENTIESLKASLAATESRAVATAPSGLSEEVRTLLRQAMSKDAKLIDALRVIALLYPQRVIILDSAWKSAREAESFNNPRKAFDLLCTLCGEYADMLSSGKSDADARALFGKSLSAKESETVENNKRARKLRTFDYKGKSIEMMMHIKIGNKDSVAETFRAHFEWDSENRQIVIGHCGKHLNQE